MQTGIYILEPPVLKEGTLFKVYINIYIYIQKIYQNVLMFVDGVVKGKPEMLHCSVKVHIYQVVC